MDASLYQLHLLLFLLECHTYIEILRLLLNCISKLTSLSHNIVIESHFSSKTKPKQCNFGNFNESQNIIEVGLTDFNHCSDDHPTVLFISKAKNGFKTKGTIVVNLTKASWEHIYFTYNVISEQIIVGWQRKSINAHVFVVTLLISNRMCVSCSDHAKK